MSPYLLDTNTLIQAKNEYYSFNICPGFWEWLDTANRRGRVFSIAPVLEEICEGVDDLTTWATARSDFFLPFNQRAVGCLAEVTRWVMDGDFRDEAKHLFLSKADPLLVAYALSHGFTLVSHEVHVEGERRRVKIPTVCQGLGVRCVRTFQMLSDEQVRFGLLV